MVLYRKTADNIVWISLHIPADPVMNTQPFLDLVRVTTSNGRIFMVDEDGMIDKEIISIFDNLEYPFRLSRLNDVGNHQKDDMTMKFEFQIRQDHPDGSYTYTSCDIGHSNYLKNVNDVGEQDYLAVDLADIRKTLMETEDILGVKYKACIMRNDAYAEELLARVVKAHNLLGYSVSVYA